MCQREKRSCNGNKSFPATRSMLQREHYYRLSRSRSYNGNLCRKLNKQKKPAPEMTPGRALLCLRKPKTLEYQGFQAKRKCTVILSKLPCIGGIPTARGYNAPCFESVVHFCGVRPNAPGQWGQAGQNTACFSGAFFPPHLFRQPEAALQQILSGISLENTQKKRTKTHACVFAILLCDTWLPHLFHPKTVAPRFLAFAEFCMLGGVSHVEAPPHLRV